MPRIALRNAAEAINAGKPFPRRLLPASEPGGEMPDVPSWTSIQVGNGFLFRKSFLVPIRIGRDDPAGLSRR